MGVNRDYEPPDKPFSKLNARRAILRKMIEIEGAQSHVRRLFDSCYGAYLNWQLRGQSTADWHELEKRLKQWARGCHIEDDWFISFAYRTLFQYWRASNERRLRRSAYRAVTGRDLDSEGAFEYQIQDWRRAVAALEVEKPSDWNLSPPSPPEGLPMINIMAMPTVATRKQYMAQVRFGLLDQLLNGPARLLQKATRERWVTDGMEEITPLIDSFWFEYSTYLYSQGWVPIESKRSLNLHSEWLVHAVVLDTPLSKIADGITESAIGKAIRELAALAGVTLEERRGRKSNL